MSLENERGLTRLEINRDVVALRQLVLELAVKFKLLSESKATRENIFALKNVHKTRIALELKKRKFRLMDILEELELERSNYYYNVSRVEEENLIIAKLEQLHQQFPKYGYRKLHQVLMQWSEEENQGLDVCVNRVHVLCKRYGWYASGNYRELESNVEEQTSFDDKD